LDILYKVQKVPDGTAVALGAFDGIHIGHQKLIENVVNYSRKNGCKSCVFTFDELPSGADFITNNTERFKIFEKLGVDILCVQPFDNSFKNLSAFDFMSNYLLQCRYITVGFNFKFGMDRTGNSDILRNFCVQNNIECDIVSPVICDGDVVSSSRIRKLLKDGSLQDVNRLLGHAFCVNGTVIIGNQVGRTMEFPTANIKVEANRAMPPYGVYATVTEYDGVLYKSITSYGTKPTFSSEEVLIETNIFDFNENIYDKNITVYFVNRIRDIESFGSIEELKSKIIEDKSKSLEFFSKNGLQI